MNRNTKTGGEMAVVYARYSSHNQGEQSIEGQLSAAKTFAEAKGYTIVHEYIDRAMTGRNDNRYEFQKMLTDCAKGQFQVIIVWKVDRFGRNRQEITFNKYRAKKHGVRVEYVAENLPDSPEGVILESVLEGMAEYYSLQLSQNIQRGLLESAKKHHAIGGHGLLGYTIGADKTYQIDPETAPTVKMIFDLYAAGHTMSEITKILNAQGFRNKNGKPFSNSNLRVILNNEKYTGTYIYKDLIRDEGAMPAIVDKNVFATVQKMLKVNRRMPSHKWTYTDYLLTGKLFCGHCGSNMIGECGRGANSEKYSYYTCTKHRKENSCDKKSVRQDLLEESVLTEVQKLLQNDELMDFIAENTWKYYQAQDLNQEQVRALQKQLSDAQNAINNLVRSIEAGIFNDAIKARMDELTAQETALKKALADMEIQSGFKLTKDHILYFLEQFRNLDYTDRDCQRRLVEVFVNSIFLYNDHLTVTFNFSGDGNSTTVTLQNLKDAEQGGSFVRCAPCSRKAITPEIKIVWFQNVFAIDVKMPEV